MNALLEKYNDYMRLKNCTAEYLLANDTKIKSDYLLYEQKGNQKYNHLGIALDPVTGERYIETFFHQNTNMYIIGQQTMKIKSFTLYSPNNEIIVTDSF
jgi:hypothetical protein